MGVGNIKLNDGRLFSLEFSSTVGNTLLAGAGATAIGGPIGLGAATAFDKRATEIEATTDLPWWTENLAKYGVRGLQMSAKGIYGTDKAGWWIIGIVVGVGMLLMIVAAIIYAISAAGIA